MIVRTLAAALALALPAAALTACAGAARNAVVPGAGGLPDASRLVAIDAAAPPTTTPIKHIVIVIQENRSFDNFFATYPGANGHRKGETSYHRWVPLVKADLKGQDIGHMHFTWLREYDQGKMDGFNLLYFDTGGPARLYPYQYVDPAQIAPYWSMARQYALADRMFQTQSSGSFTAHQDLIAGGTAIDASKRKSIVDVPYNTFWWGCDAQQGSVTSLLTADHRYLINKGPFPCFDYPTMRDLLDAKGVSWKFYTPIASLGGHFWSAFDAIRAVRYSKEWTANVVSPETTLFSDVDHGRLPAVSWVVPDFQNSDHPGAGYDGPSWVAQVVDTIGHSAYWNSTAVVVVWDDWGGFYDHVPPPQLDYQGLGFRVPCLIVSPYVPPGYISHTQYEFGSILKFIENNWTLGSLGTTDVRAASIADVFDFTKPPRTFAPIPATRSRAFFEHEAPSRKDVDDE